MEPFPSLCNQVSFFIPLVVAAFSFIVMAFATQGYFARRTKVLACLSFFLLFASLAVFLDPFFVFLQLNTDVIPDPLNTYYWTFANVFPFALISIANAFLVWFIVLVFYQEQKRPFFYGLVIASLAMAAIIPLVGIAKDRNHTLDDTFVAVLVIYLAISLVIYLLLAVKSFQTSARIQKSIDNVSRAGMNFIGLCSIFLLSTIGSFVMQELPGIIPEFAAALEVAGFKQGGCTYFTTIGWVLSGVSLVLIYLGCIMPDWLRRRIQGMKTTRK
jgi:hypothetical protein